MTITIGGWVLIATGIICGIVCIGLAIYFASNDEPGAAVVAVIIGLLLAAAFIIGTIVYSGTEAGKRAYKDQESNFSNGITRTVTVYDIDGNIIEQYSGKFDVETDNDGYILFDDESGKRHIIYFTTGTVIIDEE